METYIETINRYRIIRHEDLPEQHKAAYRIEGIDPDDLWSLIWSFNDKDAAERKLAQLVADAPKFYTYKLVDGGQTEQVERQAWF